jgi:hypothetical protein
MSLYSEYDNFYKAHTPPHILGGKNRAVKAVRDRYGRFLPTEPWRQDFHEPTEPHGRAGGLKRAATAKRQQGKFARSES